jgi:hypothetical protein
VIPTSFLLPLVLSAAPSLLLNAQLRKDQGVTRASVVRDGTATWEGDNWDTEFTAIVGRGAMLEWDLGEVLPIRAALLQGDNNDEYTLWASEDGLTFTPLWKVPLEPLAGMRTRTTKTLDAKARYLRLTADGGDGMYSVGEVQVFAEATALATETVTRRPTPPPPPRPLPIVDRSLYLVVALGALVAIYFSRRRQPLGAPPSADAPKA